VAAQFYGSASNATYGHGWRFYSHRKICVPALHAKEELDYFDRIRGTPISQPNQAMLSELPMLPCGG